MKIKKNSENVIQALKSITDTETVAVPTFLSLDLNGNLIIESFNKLLDYDNEKVSISAGNKTIYIYGDELKITSFSKSNLQIDGKIFKIEMFEVK